MTWHIHVIKYFFPLAGFDLRTFNDAVGKNEENLPGRDKKKPGNLPGREGKYLPDISPSGRLWSGTRTTGHVNFPRIYLQCIDLIPPFIWRHRLKVLYLVRKTRKKNNNGDDIKPVALIYINLLSSHLLFFSGWHAGRFTGRVLPSVH